RPRSRPPLLPQPVHGMARACVTLTREEWKIFRLVKYPDQQLTDWLFGRIAAKDAVRALWFERHGQRLFPADIELGTDAGGCVRPCYRGEALVDELPRVSFASVPGTSAAAAAFGRDVRLILRHCGSDVTADVAQGEMR